MAAGDHVINNKKVDPKKAKARHGKIFVGGLDVETSEDDIRSFFGQYGTVSLDSKNLNLYSRNSIQIMKLSLLKALHSLEFKYKCRNHIA